MIDGVICPRCLEEFSCRIRKLSTAYFTQFCPHCGYRMRIPVLNNYIFPGFRQLYLIPGYFALLAGYSYYCCITEKSNPKEIVIAFGLNIYCILAGLISIFALFAAINAVIYAHIKASFDNSQDEALDRKRMAHKNIVKGDFNQWEDI